MGIEGKTIVPKDKSKNSFYNATSKWRQTKEVLQFTTHNGGKATMDEIPAGGVREKIAQQEKQIQNDKFLESINTTSATMSNATSVSPSSSEIFISSEQSSEESKDIQQESKSKPSQIPRRNSKISPNNSLFGSYSSSSSLLSNLATASIPRLIKQPVRKNTSSSDCSTRSSSPIICEINKHTREALLSANHPFLKGISYDRKKEPTSYRITDKVRVRELTDNEISQLEDKKVPILGKR